MSDINIHIPIHITISGQPPAAVVTTTPGAAKSITAETQTALERVVIDPDYGNRAGYDVNFLGVAVALPTLTEEQRRNAAKNSRARQGEDPTVLPYHHFSLVMNRRRQLALYTAVNIDGSRSQSPERSGDRWFFDPRIADSEQIGEDLYARNDLDRGHLVRRLDPAWGSDTEALNANNDTFHFTNCSPQHAQFNQNNETWQGIENYLLNQARQQRRRLTIFTGPVMAEDDPLYRGVRLPLYFWKIAVFVGDDNTLSVTAYLLDQKELVERLPGLERFDADTFQVTVEEISQRTGINFSYLAQQQPELERHTLGLERTTSGFARRKLTRNSDIQLR